jgi:kynurenine formamidase
MRNFPLLNINFSRVIHLSHVIDTNIPQWPGDPQVEFTTIAEINNDGYYLRKLDIGEHSATHINAPKSFEHQGISIEQYSAQSLVVPAIVINICHQATLNPDYLLTIGDIQTWEQEYGLIPPSSVVLLYTGWQEKWSDHSAFFNQDAAGNMHFPGFGSVATQFLIEQRQVAGVGIDTHGVDSGQDNNFSTNRLVLTQPRIVLENLANLDQLPPTGTTLVIGILRLRGGSGSPAAVMAFV